MAQWVIQKTDNPKFPVRINIIEGDRTLLSLYAQGSWPGQKGNIFCLRASEDGTTKVFDEVLEQIPVITVKRLGKKMSVVLDRAHKKRCDFLFLEKTYKHKQGTYEQIFFRTQQGLRQHKSKSNLNYRHSGQPLNIVIDSNEKYAWSFPEHTAIKENLPSGDYALQDGKQVVAVVERKTFDNIRSDISKIQILHQQMHELSLYPFSAMVIEGTYSDFFDTKKISPLNPQYAGKVLAELTVAHPSVSLIFAGSRKDANYWCKRFFESAAAKTSDKDTANINEVTSATKEKPSQPIWLKLKYAIENDMPQFFSSKMLRAKFSEYPAAKITQQLGRFKKDGYLIKSGAGAGTVWAINKEGKK